MIEKFLDDLQLLYKLNGNDCVYLKNLNQDESEDLYKGKLRMGRVEMHRYRHTFFYNEKTNTISCSNGREYIAIFNDHVIADPAEDVEITPTLLVKLLIKAQK